MHPSEAIRCAKGHELEGKRIVLGVTGSIAAVEAFELVRELIRHGAEVHVVMTGEAVKLVTPQAMEFASGRPAITALTGAVEHVSLLGDYPGRADLLLVAPCTANTLSKMALGIDDTPVTTMATVAIGSMVPVVVAPAMHLAMYQHPSVRSNVERLTAMGVRFVGPTIVAKKARAASTEEIVEEVLSALSPQDLAGRRVLVIGGSSEEPIDAVRVVTNTGTGETAAALARSARRRGAQVELWAGRTSVLAPPGVGVRTFRKVEELVSMADDVDHDAVLVPASLSDYSPREVKGKLPSGRSALVVRLEPRPKVLPLLRPRTKVLVGFKLEAGTSASRLLEKARARMDEYGLDIMVANDLKDVGTGHSKVTIITSRGNESVKGTKLEVANKILDEVAKAL